MLEHGYDDPKARVSSSAAGIFTHFWGARIPCLAEVAFRDQWLLAYLLGAAQARR